MTKSAFQSFDRGMLPEIGVLLAERQRTVRQTMPRLPDTFDSPEAATNVVTTFANQPDVMGTVAQIDGRLVAYLLAERVADMLWGRAVWMRFPGCAVAEGINREIIRDLYATLTAPLVRQGFFNHFAVVPVAETALVQAFFALSFGIEQVHGILDLHDITVAPPTLPAGMTIRRANAADREILEGFSGTIWRHQTTAPVWGIHLPEREATQRKSYGDRADDAEAIVYLAFIDGVPAGVQMYFPPDPDDPIDMLCWPDGLELCTASTLPEFRGRGVGTALTQFGLYAAREAGCRYILTDWRSTNLLSSRFWPRRGFVPVAYRLARRVDHRIAWGNAEPAV